jgi:hypothetical protein
MKGILLMELYKFRGLQNVCDFKRVTDIIKNGFYCNGILGFNDMNEGVYINNPRNRDVNLSIKQKYKICSFSGKRALNSELMWGHYANTGRGIIIEVDVKDCSKIKQVKYGSNNNLNTIEEILTNKSEVWAHEDEYRYLSTDNLVGNKVKIGEITKIYFGTPYEKLSNYQEIKDNHIALKAYYSFKEDLKVVCNKNNINCEDFEF